MAIREVYAYDEQGYFVKTVKQNIDQINNKYPSLKSATDKPLPNYNPVLEIPKFSNDEWLLEDLQQVGTFYAKADGQKVLEILKKDADLYTQIEPLKKYDDGTRQQFNDLDNSWSYTEKGVDLLEEERIQELEIARTQKLIELTDAYNNSKKITISNGRQMIIAHDNPNRKFFKDLLKRYIYKINKDDEVSRTPATYSQPSEGGKVLQISMLPFFWNRMFHLAFRKPTPMGYHEYIPDYNGLKNLKLVEQINHASSVEELDGIVFDFYSPDGIVINVTEEAEQLLDQLDPANDAELIGLINALKDENGQVHLISEI